jgi:natural product precursor
MKANLKLNSLANQNLKTKEMNNILGGKEIKAECSCSCRKSSDGISAADDDACDNACSTYSK